MSKRKKLMKLAGDPQFISGVYNYCDRWCERCPLTARCLNFAMSEEEIDATETRDIRNEVYWQRLGEVLQETMALIRETAEMHGVDLDAIEAEASTVEERLGREAAESQRICRAAKAYAVMTEDWFRDVGELFSQGEEGAGPKWQTHADGPSDERAGLKQVLEVVRWYQHLIYTKLTRAFRSKTLEDRQNDLEFARDSDGSAKVALIAIDRSIAAWGDVRNRFPFQNKAIQEMLFQLERLRKNAEHTFPDARAFIRPGLDKIDLNS
jgi:hypothetical protein